MPELDLELEAWREQWQTAAKVPADLRRRIARGTRSMRLMLVMEAIVTVTIGGGSTLWAVVDPRKEMLVLALAVWLFLGAAWTFAIVNRRGTWSPAAMTTAEYVDLSIRRCRAKIAAMRFGVGLYFAEMAFCLAWLYRDPARRVPTPAVIFAVVTPVFLVGVARLQRRTQAELLRLMEFARPLVP